MNICVYKNDYFKESSDIKRAIVCGVRSLYERIALYENQNVPFERIFNDERVKYDKHGDFYTFKCKKSDVQLRILYTYIVIDDTPVIVVADFFVKKKNNNSDFPYGLLIGGGAALLLITTGIIFFIVFAKKRKKKN